MTKPKLTESRGEALVKSLLSVKNDKFEVWKYFEERADKLGERLWSTGTWLIGLLAATVSLPFAAKFIEFPATGFPVRVTQRIPVAFIAVFGIALCLYSYHALLDLREHIEGNWRRSTYALTDKWEQPDWGGRKRHGWNILLGVGVLALVAFVILLIFACLP